MFSKDYLIRQLQQFVQALSLVLFHRREGKHDLAQSIIHNTMMDALGKPLSDVRLLDRDALMGLVTRSGAFDGDLALAMADLLREDESPDGRKRALWLYEEAFSRSATLPLDISERIAALQEGDRT